jgi:hypothetical protein
MELQLTSPQQHAIADLLWAAQDEAEVQEIVDTYGHPALVVRELMIAAAMDEIDDTELAAEVIKGLF